MLRRFPQVAAQAVALAVALRNPQPPCQPTAVSK